MKCSDFSIQLIDLFVSLVSPFGCIVQVHNGKTRQDIVFGSSIGTGDVLPFSSAQRERTCRPSVSPLLLDEKTIQIACRVGFFSLTCC